MPLTEKYKKLIDSYYSKYDSEMELIKVFYVPNYHSNLEKGEHYSLIYNADLAVSIFYNEYEELYPIANKILKKLAHLQRKEGALKGLWSYFAEESLEEMVAPDGNYADFIAIPMLNCLLEHSDKLEEGVAEILKEACFNACFAIMKRDLTIIYTNPSVMDMYVTIVSGEICGEQKFIDYGKRKLAKFYNHIMENGVFDEYNCPGYSMLIAEIFSIMLRHIKDNEASEKINELNFTVWKMLGEHCHAKSGEIAGPNFRRYINFLSDEERSKFSEATDINMGEGNAEVNLSDKMYTPTCPKELRCLFCDERTEFSRRLITRGTNYPWFNQADVDTYFVCPEYFISSFSLMDGWNQRNSLSVYIGNKEEKACVRLRILHDGYDFSSGAVATVQEGSSALTVVNFHTNHGDTHVDLDPIKDNTIKACDLRIRFQIEANNAEAHKKINVAKKENTAFCDVLGTRVKISFPYAEMEGFEPYMEISEKDNEYFADLVLYSGEEREINLKELEGICAVTLLSVNESRAEIKSICKQGELLLVDALLEESNAQIKALYKADEQIRSTMETRLLLNGERVEYLAEVSG